jgi:uncharacterized protein (TIGR02147 family)
MQNIDIFEFNDPREYLLKVFKNKREKNPRFSLRAWSKQIGLKNHVMLSMTLNGKRNLSSNIAGKIRNSLNLSIDEARYFDTLIHYKNAYSNDEKIFYANILDALRPEKGFSELDLDIFRLISDWYHMAIIEMTNLKDFKSDPKWIASRLGGDVSVSEVEKAIERLVRLKVLKAVDNKLVQTDGFRTTPSDIPNEAIKKYHMQILDKAKEALYSQNISERNFQAYTMCIDTAKIPEAKKLMTEFERKLSALMESGSGNEVYQFNMQLFKLTENGGKNEN